MDYNKIQIVSKILEDRLNNLDSLSNDTNIIDVISTSIIFKFITSQTLR